MGKSREGILAFYPLPEKLPLLLILQVFQLLNSVGFLISLNTLFNIYLESCLGVYKFKLPVLLFAFVHISHLCNL